MVRFYQLVLVFSSLVFFGFTFQGRVGGGEGVFSPSHAPNNGSLAHEPNLLEPVPALAPRILIFHALSYDSLYGQSIRTLVTEYFPDARVRDFRSGSSYDLERALLDCQLVVVVYPSMQESVDRIQAYGSVFQRFADDGGTVILTGSHDLDALRHLNLLEIGHAFFCTTPAVHEQSTADYLLSGTPADFSLRNYAYPIEVSDPEYYSLAGLQNEFVYGYRDMYTVDSVHSSVFTKPPSILGYRKSGKGVIYYLGFEYFYDELPSTRIFVNAIRRAAEDAGVSTDRPAPMQAQSTMRSATPKRVEEHLVAGSGRYRLDLKLYPNPYVVKANVDLVLDAPAQISLEMVDENGRLVSILLPPRELQAGNFRFELPDVLPGIYFVKCTKDGYVETRKVVKSKSL